MVKITFISILSSVALIGCATPSHNYTPEVSYISRPETGITTTAAVGDEMLVQGNLSTKEGISLTNAQKLSMYSLSPGFYPKVGDDEKHSYFSFRTGDGKNSLGGLGTAKKGLLADPLQNIAIKKEDQQLCAVTVFNLKTCKKDIEYKLDNKTNESLNSFQQTLIYSGRVGDKINISYREFSGNSARPAYNNDVEYDLKADKTIAYKGAQISVLDADNKEITYIVNKNFREPKD